MVGSPIDFDQNNPSSEEFYQDEALYFGYAMAENSPPLPTTKWNRGGVLRLVTKNSLYPDGSGGAPAWTMSKVIEGIGPVTAGVAKLQNYKTDIVRLYFAMHPLRSFRWTTTSIAALVVAGLGGCRDAGTPAAPLFNTTPGSGEFKGCKVGTAASFTVTVNQEAPTTLFLGPGECAVVATGSGYATVTENADAQVVLDSIVKTFNESGVIKNWTHVGTYTLGPLPFSADVSVLLTFYNRYVGTGRMTGGGRQITIGDLKVTRGCTIHCDITLSNNLEINWPNNHWHITKPLTSAECVDDPMISPEPPPAPFDRPLGDDGVPLVSKSSLVRSSPFATSPGFTLAGRRAARLMYAALEKQDPSTINAALEAYRTMIPRERFGDEYLAWQWFCEYLRASPRVKQQLLGEAVNHDKIKDKKAGR